MPARTKQSAQRGKLNPHCAQRKMNINVHAQNTKITTKELYYICAARCVPSYAIYVSCIYIYIYISIYSRFPSSRSLRITTTISTTLVVVNPFRVCMPPQLGWSASITLLQHIASLKSARTVCFICSVSRVCVCTIMCRVCAVYIRLCRYGNTL